MARFDDQLERGLKRLRSVAGKTVTYRRGAQSVAWNVIVGQSDYTTTDDSGMPVSNQTRDFMGAGAELVLGGERIDPHVGDVIEESDGIRVRTHFVTALGDDQPWRWCDAGRSTLRVHTKERGIT